jgi:hypothetical protein
VRVDLGGAHIGVAKKFLERSDVLSGLQQVRGSRAAAVAARQTERSEALEQSGRVQEPEEAPVSKA